jgi:hypothetical protein
MPAGANSSVGTALMRITPSKHFEGSDLIAATVDTFVLWRRYLDRLDWSAGNRNRSGYLAFLRAGSLGIDPDAAVKEVTRRITDSGGTFNPGDIQRQLRNAYQHAGRETGELTALVKPAKPTFCPQKLAQLAAKVPGVNPKYLAARSPSPLFRKSGMFLNSVFEPGEKILLFTGFQSQGQILFQTGQVWNPQIPTQTEDGAWYLINPVDGEYHPNPRQGNKPSRRSEESITSWRYLLLESDVADRDQWLSCLIQLPLRIVAIYTSGGKSVHALVRLDATSKADWDKQCAEIKPIVVALGADENALTAVRLSRLPGVMRGETRQRLLYLNPDADGTPIMNLRKISNR